MIIIDSRTTNDAANCFGFWIPGKPEYVLPEFIVVKWHIWDIFQCYFKEYYEIDI